MTFLSNSARVAATIIVTVGGLTLGGCTGKDGSPVFGAVFGLENANDKAYREGIVPAPTVQAGDAVIGKAANAPNQCIWRRATTSRRFEADCPDDFQL